MSAALKRELFTLKHNLFYLIYTAVFAIVAVLENCIDNAGTFFFVLLTIFVACLYAVNTLSNEAKFRFDKQVTALPVTPNHVVISKYIVSFGYSLFVSVVLILVKQLLFIVHVSMEDMLPLIPLFLAFYGVCAAVMSIVFVLSFAFGANKALTFVIALCASLGFFIGFMSSVDEEGEGLLHALLALVNSPYIWFVFVGGLLLYIVSLPLSAKLYTHRIQK